MEPYNAKAQTELGYITPVTTPSEDNTNLNNFSINPPTSKYTNNNYDYYANDNDNIPEDILKDEYPEDEENINNRYSPDDNKTWDVTWDDKGNVRFK